MKYFISDLIVGMKHFVEFADWIESNEDPDLGIEFTAFTHDEAYWQALAAKVPQMTCPLPFHGPYVNIEATSDIGSEEMYGSWKAIKRYLRWRCRIRYAMWYSIIRSCNLSRKKFRKSRRMPIGSWKN